MAEDNLRNKLNYPFSAVVGCELAKKALICALSSPDIKSILICGPKGTGKSVLANSVSSICGERVVIKLPTGSTEDSVFGSMDLESAISEGKRKVSDSVLTRANGNILLVENANLLPHEMLYQVMNAADDGFCAVERDGISEICECDFLLIATMDPEEGALTEHSLDRFDICVFLNNTEDESERESIVTNRLEYERDRELFVNRYRKEDEEICRRIHNARSRSIYSSLPKGYISAITEICSKLNIEGHRGDIAVMNSACSFAALDDRDTANLDDLKNASAICLEHRRKDTTPKEEDQQEPPSPQDSNDDRYEEPENDNNSDRNHNDHERGPELPPPSPSEIDAEDQVFEIGDAYKVIDYLPNEERLRSMTRSGRHTSSRTKDNAGRVIGYRIPKSRIHDIALIASIRIAAPYQIMRDHSNLAIVLEKDDLRENVREKRQGNNILFLVDGSGSIGAQKRMVAVKGAILSMLKDAYQKRDSIGMAVFRTDKAEEVLPMTNSILRAYKVLSDIPTGGRTPLTHGLIKGHEILKERASRDSSPVMVILSDGRCNVPFTQDRRPVDEMLSTARALSETGTRFIVIDTENGRLKLGLAMDLAMALDATYLKLEDLNAEYIESSVRQALNL